jgi:hypothetical protein
MPRDRGRLLITGVALALALAILLFPPRTARAVRSTTRYAAVQGVAPATLVDTVVWTLRASFVFAPPRTPVTATVMRALAARSLAGDTAAKQRLLGLTEPFERKVAAPEILRASGELWRDSVLAAAGIPSLSGYEVTFAVDELGVALRLASVALVAFILEVRRSGARSSRRGRADGHRRASVES